jgi:hypothetical protein
MLNNQKILEITKDVAHTRVNDGNLERVVIEPATDSEGHEALRITLVVNPEAARKLTGDEALDLLVGIQQKLRAEGEERFPIVEYATEQELVNEDSQQDTDENEDDA